MRSLIICLFSIILYSLGCSSQSHFEKVLLKNVDSIVLREGQTTNARRVSPIPQLRCVGGSAGCSATPRPNLVVCTNAGMQRQEVRWECEADFDQRYRFGRLQVSCEGYANSEDPYILKDSCGLEYEVEYDYSHASNQQSDWYSSGQESSWFSFTSILLLAAICILAYAIYKNSMEGGAEGATSAPAAPAAAATGAGTAGSWGNFMTGMFVGGIANCIFSTISSLFRPNPYGYRPGYGYGGGMSGWGGGRRGYYGGGGYRAGGGFSSGGGISSGGGGGTSRKSGFGGTTKR